MKKLNFKIIICILLFFTILTSCSSQKLIYEPLGEMDKPLPTITIMVGKNNDLYGKVFKVDEKTFQSLVKYVQSKSVDNLTKNKTEYEYGSYKIIYSKGSKKNEYVVETKENSSTFFQGQLKLIKSNEKLFQEIEVLLKRIQ